jgi:hypothetical protein
VDLPHRIDEDLLSLLQAASGEFRGGRGLGGGIVKDIRKVLFCKCLELGEWLWSSDCQAHGSRQVEGAVESFHLLSEEVRIPFRVTLR